MSNDLTGGNELKSRGVCDTRTNFYLVDTNNPININGDINGWEIWADTIAPLQLIIYRKDGSSWSVVGKSDTKTPVVGLNQFSLSTPMTVKQGDFVGIYYPGGGSVSFNRTTDKEAWDLGNLTGKVLFTTTGAGATAFSGSSNRVYSIRVKGVAQVIQPTSDKTIPGVIGIGMNNQLYTRKTLTSNWEHIANSGSVLGIVCYSGVALAPKSQPEVKPETTPVLKSLGRIVVNADEWTISDAGIKTTPDAATFALNIAKYFVGENKGKFHVLSNNFGLTGASLEQTMTKADHTWTKGMNIPINLETLQKYDGIFIGGDPVNNQVLIEYVKNGGKVYLCAGTGQGGAQVEANNWNTFLAAFGLKFQGAYNGIGGNIAVNNPNHPLFAGVKTLYQNNGNSITDLQADSPLNQIILAHSSGQGLIGTAEFIKPPAPEPTPQAIAQSTPEVKPEPTPEPIAQSTPEVKPESTPESIAQSTPEVKPESTPQAIAQSTPEVKPEPTPQAIAQSTPEVKPESTPESIAQSTPEVKPEPTPQAIAESTPEVKPETTVESTPETPVSDSEEFTITATQGVTISKLSYKGQVKRTQSDEYIEISNFGNIPADISGWKITSAGSPKQVLTFPQGTVLEGSKSFCVYTNEVHPETGGFSFGSRSAIWNDAGDEAKLFDAAGNNVSTLAYGKNTVAGIKQELKVPQLKFVATYNAVNKQMSLGGKVTFTEAVSLAIRSFLEDESDAESPLGLILNDPDSFDLPNDVTKAVATEKLRSYLNENGVLTLYPTEKRSTAENGETVDKNWIFELSLDAMSDVIFWAIVPRSGNEKVYNYGFS
ncbi:lamin tail domain-containing protein [Sphaerospermopsis torques-reginae]|uniref:Lamin tail domain-containing protein n=1 Tax=Sphaerospermopsis torques-reginae ITEP-024 TaxID=984208 RepID=A0ABX8WXV9_9CYAN|nr:lamin tail domain-containing protein [Sphaerospermopsis torques-reginae]QYX31207.1 lamin tail domain-containing protein [Sphaerospermopsis torques-reginae ITEP-024]